MRQVVQALKGVPHDTKQNNNLTGSGYVQRPVFVKHFANVIPEICGLCSIRCYKLSGLPNATDSKSDKSNFYFSPA
jgi:hypothetical protein